MYGSGYPHWSTSSPEVAAAGLDGLHNATMCCGENASELYGLTAADRRAGAMTTIERFDPHTEHDDGQKEIAVAIVDTDVHPMPVSMTYSSLMRPPNGWTRSANRKRRHPGAAFL